MTILHTLEDLEALYGAPAAPSLVKETDRIVPDYRPYIERSPFVILATSGPQGLDCSPRGDRPGFVRIGDDRTLLLPDRRGNNRIDSLRNVIGDPRVALLFLIPGAGVTLRVNGKAAISVDRDLLQSFAVDGKPPRSVLQIAVQAVYFQCARAVIRSELWDPAHHADPQSLPSAGQMLAGLSEAQVGGGDYDRVWQARAKETLW
jgi:uncharacterized protein